MEDWDGGRRRKREGDCSSDVFTGLLACLKWLLTAELTWARLKDLAMAAEIALHLQGCASHIHCQLRIP